MGGHEVCYTLDEFLCLKPNEQINDDTVEYFMNQLAQRYNVLCMSPRFYSRLTCPSTDPVNEETNDSAVVNASKSRISYEHVRKWCSTVFRNDLVFIPVVRDFHWTLIVVCYPWATPQVAAMAGKKRTAPGVEEPLVTTILAFDSCSRLGRVNERLVNPIRDYLTLQWVQENGGSGVDFSDVELVKMNTPQQRNKVDCGLYVLRMTEEIAKNVPPHEMCRMHVDKSGFRKRYMRAFHFKEMKKYRRELKNAVKVMSQEQGRWSDTWNALL